MSGVTFKNASEQVVADMLAHPTVIVGSDAFPYTAKSDGSIVYDWDTPFDAVNGHPRGAGTHALVLQMVVCLQKAFLTLWSTAQSWSRTPRC